MELILFIETIGIIAAVVVFASELISTKLTHATGWWARIQTWVLALGLVFLADFVPVTEIFVLAWWWKVVAGALTGLVANGLWTIDELKALLEKIGFRKS